MAKNDLSFREDRYQKIMAAEMEKEGGHNGRRTGKETGDPATEGANTTEYEERDPDVDEEPWQVLNLDAEARQLGGEAEVG